MDKSLFLSVKNIQVLQQGGKTNKCDHSGNLSTLSKIYKYNLFANYCLCQLVKRMIK